MTSMISRVAVILLTLAYTSAHAQILKGIGKKLKEETTKVLKDKSDEAVTDQRSKFDSLDFQFAISVHDNSGFIDVAQEGEWMKKLTVLKSELTPADVASQKLDTANFFYDRRFFRLAELYYIGTKDYIEKNGLKDDIIYLRCLSNIGLTNLAQYKVGEAEKVIDDVLATSEKNIGKESAAYVANLNSHAKLNQQVGKYNEAEKEFGEAIDLAGKVFGEASMQYAIVLNNQAMLFQLMGRYDEAERMMKKAIAAAEAAPKKALQTKRAYERSFDSRRFMSNLAIMYHLSGKYEEADKAYSELQKQFETLRQTNNPEYAALINQIAILYIQMGKDDKVEELLKKAAGIYKYKYTEQHPSFAKVCADLGNFYRMKGRYADAEAQFEKAIRIRETTLGTSHPDYVKSQEDLAILYWKTGKTQRAYMTYREVMDKTIDFINKYFPPMSEAEKTSYWDVTALRFQRFFNFSIEAQKDQEFISQDFFDYHMATKALLLNSTNKVKQAILKSSDKALIKDYLDWLDQKEQLARFYALSKEQLKEQKINLDELERKANAMEKSLSMRSTDFSSGYSTQRISYKQILGLLNEGEALVDIVRVRGFGQNFNDETQYVALILKKGLEYPKLVVLDNGKLLETRYIKYYRNAVQKRIEDTYSYDQFWSRIDKEIKVAKVVYYSPDGVFNQMNVNTLRKADGSYVVKSFELVTIGNAKDLINLKTKKPTPAKKNAFLLGFPDYATNDVSPLPGTKVEVDAVAKVLKTSGYTVNQYMQKNATESTVKGLHGPYVMHIATHGYFLEDVERSGSAFGVSGENALDNPLLRSGLILAGAGKTIEGESNIDVTTNDNGILTAYEAMNLDLEGTDLVILSACETGLGDIKSGEGVYGLQRAFLVAGADALIMSLWKVDDAASQMLMTNFYTNWVKLKDKQKAFKLAQIQLMAKYKEPYYWGAFVMMGK